jgi:hypothetical protein
MRAGGEKDWLTWRKAFRLLLFESSGTILLFESAAE